MALVAVRKGNSQRLESQCIDEIMPAVPQDSAASHSAASTRRKACAVHIPL